MAEWSKGYREMNRPGASSQAASISKVATALTVLRVLQEEKITLEVSVSGLIEKELWSKIKKFHLMNAKSQIATAKMRLSSLMMFLSSAVYSIYPKKRRSAKRQASRSSKSEKK